MDIDETKKRKTEEPEKIDVEEILKQYMESIHKLSKLINLLAVKIVNLEKVFNKDLLN